MKKISKTLVSAILALSVSGITTSCSSENNDELNTIQTEAETLNDQQALALADNALFEYYHKAFGLSFIVETFTSKTHSFALPFLMQTMPSRRLPLQQVSANKPRKKPLPVPSWLVPWVTTYSSDCGVKYLSIHQPMAIRRPVPASTLSTHRL